MDEDKDFEGNNGSYPTRQGDSDIPKFQDWEGWVPGGRNYRLNPYPAEKEVLAKFFEIRPTVSSDNLAVQIVCQETGRKKEFVAKIIRKHGVKEEAKRQRQEYADEIYKNKVPLAKAIAALSLTSLHDFLGTFKAETIEDAKGLARIATDMNTLLRLELGQSTQNIEIVQKTEKSVTVILEELRQVDPFVDYPKLPDVKSK